MKILSFKDMGCCDITVQAETVEEIKKKAWEHAQKNHPEKIKDITPEMETQLNAKLENCIHDA